MANFNAGTQMFYTRPSDGATYCFSPVPLLAHSKEFTRTADNSQRLSVTNQYTFNGVLLPTIPALSGVPADASCLQLLDRKSDQLCSALEDYGTLLIVDNSGYTVLNVSPRVASVSFDESQIVNHRKYNIVFEHETEFGTDKVSDFNEDWSFEQQDDDTISASHNISAVGVADSGVNSPIVNARNFILARIAGASPDKLQAVLLRQPFVSSLVDITNLASFNHVLTEQSNTTAGSYTAGETWVLASGAFKDDRTVEHSFELNENGNLIEVISINGTIQGYGDTTFDKFSNAVTGFATVSTEIGFNSASGISSKGSSENRFAGTISYNLSRAPSDPEAQIESRSVSRSFERNEDGSTTQTVTTSASIRVDSSGTIQQAINFCFANNFPINSADPEFNVALSGNLVSKSTQRDELAKSFNLTRVFIDQATSLWTEEFSVSSDRNVDSSQITITIDGSIQGVGEETSTKSQVRFANASGAFFGTVEALIGDRVAQLIPTGFCVSDEPSTIAFGISPLVGTISYSRSFTSRFKTSNTDILSEQIEITLARQSDVIAEIGIPGKSDGPILQDQETLTGLEKQLTITYTMAGGGSACSDAVANSNTLLATAITESDILVDNTPTAHSRGEKPESSKVFKTQDQVQFNRQELQFTRNVTWKYI